MAIEYSLLIDGPATPRTVEELLIEHLHMTRLGECALPTLVLDGIRCSLVEQSKLGRAVIDDAFKINSMVDLTCRIDKFDLHEQGMNHLIGVWLTCIAHLKGDLVIIGNGEKGLLLRKEGRLVVDISDEYWRPTWDALCSSLGITATYTHLPSL